MNVLQFLEENKMVVICVGIFICICAAVILFLIYKIEGFVLLLKKALGMVLQQLCSLVIEAVCLVFKIINALEIYVVLLIDALTGRAGSNGKIASLAIGVLSIASFYTTYSGMHFFIEQRAVAFLITLGIQAILLSTSLRINEVLNLDKATQNFFAHRNWIIGSGVVCAIVCALAYLSSILGMSYSVGKVFYHIIYMFAIVSAVIVVFLIIMELIRTGVKNSNVGIFLFVIYFTVLGVSSFFSYNAFVPVMYPDSIRNIDTLQTYRLGVINLLEQVNDAVDHDYYESVQIEIETELRELEEALARLEEDSFLTEGEKEIYEKKYDIEKYTELKEGLAAKEAEYNQEEADWLELQNSLLEHSGGVGVNARQTWEGMKEEHATKLSQIDAEIKFLSKKINGSESETGAESATGSGSETGTELAMGTESETESELEMEKELEVKWGWNPDPTVVLDIRQHEKEYIDTLERIEKKKEAYDCSEEFTLVRKLLRFDTWTQNEEKDFREAVLKMEEARLNLPEDSKKDILSNNLWDMIEVYHGYQTYRNRYSEIEDQILNLYVETGTGMKEEDDAESYEKIYNQIQSYTYELLGCLPETKYIFFNSKQEATEEATQEAIQTKALPKSNYYSTVESLKRNANPGLSEIEKNIRTFVNNKMVGITCALMALLIDMMILFVGIILPKDIHFYNNSTGKYSEQEIRRILSNLFNKPIKR